MTKYYSECIGPIRQDEFVAAVEAHPLWQQLLTEVLTGHLIKNGLVVGPAGFTTGDPDGTAIHPNSPRRLQL